MKKKLAAVAGTVALFAAVAAPAASADQGTGQGCVGSAVSTAAHATQNYLDTGFGKYFNQVVGETPGAAIQAYNAAYC